MWGEALAHLAADGVLPLWAARAYGVPLRAGHRGVALLAPTVYSRTRVRVPYLAWSGEEASLGPRALRHGLALAAVRFALGADPGRWDSLAVRAQRRTPEGRAWFRELAKEAALRGERPLEGVPRPDGEWWEPAAWYRPWAVEVDTGKAPLHQVRARLDAWKRVYAGVLWAVLSPHRAREVGGLVEAWLEEWPGFQGQVRVLWMKVWWEGGAHEWVL